MRLRTVLVVLVAMSCGPAMPGSDAGIPVEPDAGRADAGLPDAGGLDAGRPDAGEDDAGTDVDAGQPDAGAPDAGTPDAGDIDAGPIDGGCPDLMCPEFIWRSAQSSSFFFVVAPGLNVESLSRFNVYASFDVPFGSGVRASHFEYKFLDGGVYVVPRQGTSDEYAFSGGASARSLNGASVTDQWFSWGNGVKHYVGNTPSPAIDDCITDAGQSASVSYFQSVYAPNANEAWLLGAGMALCRWTAGNPVPLQTALRTGRSSIYLTDAYLTPAGELYTVGGDYVSGDSTCVIYRGPEATQVGVPTLIDTQFGDGCFAIDGVGTQVFALARDDGSGHGVILALGADAGFGIVHSAPFTLRALDVLPSGEAWAVGSSPDQLVYFDGGAWGEVPLPPGFVPPDVVWENLRGGRDGLVLSGHAGNATSRAEAVVVGLRSEGK